MWPSNSTSRYIPKRTENAFTQNLGMNFCSSIIHNSQMWKKAKCPWTDQWDVVCTQNGILFSIKRNETLIILQLCGKWKKSRHRKSHIILLIWNVQNRQIHRSRLLIARSKGAGKTESDIDGYRVLFRGDEYVLVGFPGGSDGKESACNAGNQGSIPGLGRSPGEGNGHSLWYSCLEIPKDRGAWRDTVTKSQTPLRDTFTFFFSDY